MPADTVSSPDAPTTARRYPPLLSGGWQYVNAVGLLGVIAGLVSAAAGRLWTVPIDVCGSPGRAGTDLGWALAFGAALAMLVVGGAMLVAIVGSLDRRRRHWRRAAAMSLGWTLACATAAVLGLVSNFGDSPIFCF